MQPKRRRVLVLSLAGVLCVGCAGWWRWNQSRPVYITGLNIPDAAKVGDIDYATKKMQKLVKMLEADNWKGNVPHEMWTLPDQIHSENEHHHDFRYGVIHWNQNPKPNQIAVYTDIYVRQNTKYYKGDKSVSDPHGFYLVVRGNGTAERIPVADLRMVKVPNHPNAVSVVFPGESNYDVNAPQLPFVGGDKNLAKLENLVQKHQQKH